MKLRLLTEVKIRCHLNGIAYCEHGNIISRLDNFPKHLKNELNPFYFASIIVYNGVKRVVKGTVRHDGSEEAIY